MPIEWPFNKCIHLRYRLIPYDERMDMLKRRTLMWFNSL